MLNTKDFTFLLPILWHWEYSWNYLICKSLNKFTLSGRKSQIIYIYWIDILLRVNCPILNKFEPEIWKLFAKKKKNEYSISLNWYSTVK